MPSLGKKTSRGMKKRRDKLSMLYAVKANAKKAGNVKQVAALKRKIDKGDY